MGITLIYPQLESTWVQGMEVFQGWSGGHITPYSLRFL
jgi:hypothetical protein